MGLRAIQYRKCIFALTSCQAALCLSRPDKSLLSGRASECKRIRILRKRTSFPLWRLWT